MSKDEEKKKKKKKKKTKATKGEEKPLTRRQLAALSAGKVSADYVFVSRPEDHQRG